MEHRITSILIRWWAAILLVAALFLLTACNPQRRVQKAVKTVTFNDTAFDHVGRLWLRFNPCANDTIEIGGDTTIINNPVNVEIDADSLRRVLCDTANKTTVIYVPTNCVDRIVYRDRVVVDHRAMIVLRDSLDRERFRANALAAELHGTKNSLSDCQTQMIRQTKDFGKALTKRTLIMLIPIVLLAIAVWLLIRRRINPINVVRDAGK